MKPATSLVSLLGLIPAVASATNFSLVANYSGNGFFDGWGFYGNFDNLTNGDVIYVNQTNATNLAFVTDSGTAIIKVDNTSFVPYNDKRNSVRITTNDYFTTGTVWVIDAIHLPFGCSVWPSIWTKGNNWPDNGEIDIIEGVNQMTFNQMALHTLNGCNAASGTDLTGSLTGTNCSTAAGCTVAETKPDSFGEGFASVGGGVWATQFDTSGIFIWYWARADIPTSVTTATDSIDISTWGPPSAAYSNSSCDIPEFFGAQQIVLDITLCGDWAGVASIYASTCPVTGTANASTCYLDNVINNGTSQYADAYFELNYIRAFALNASSVVDSNGDPVSTSTAASGGASAPATTTGSSAASTNTTSGARARTGGVAGALLLAVAALALLLV